MVKIIIILFNKIYPLIGHIKIYILLARKVYFTLRHVWAIHFLATGMSILNL